MDTAMGGRPATNVHSRSGGGGARSCGVGGGRIFIDAEAALSGDEESDEDDEDDEGYESSFVTEGVDTTAGSDGSQSDDGARYDSGHHWALRRSGWQRLFS